MSTPVILRANHSHLFGSSALPVLEELSDWAFASHPGVREKLFKKVSTDRDIYQTSALHDPSLFQTVQEGQDYPIERVRQGASKTFTIQKFGMGLSISKEAMADGKFDIISGGVRKLGSMARESQEIDAANVFNNGFSSETAADGVAVFSASHTLPSGRTYSNILSVPADLSQTALDTMLSNFELNFVGDSGRILNIKPSYLVVPPNSKRYAMELIGSDLKADTADNNMNSLKGEGLMVVSNPWLSDTDSWYLCAAPAESGLRIIERQAYKSEAEEQFINDSIIHKASYREELGCDQAIGIFGTAGA
jgi:hypothetical protein